MPIDIGGPGNSCWYETLALSFICFTLFRPSFWLDRLQAPFETRSAADLMQIAESIPKDLTLRFCVVSQSRAGEDVEKVARLTMRAGKTGAERLQGAGLSVRATGNKVIALNVRFGSEASKYGLAAGDEIKSVLVPVHRSSRYWFAIPALLLLAGVVALQRNRKRQKLKVAIAG